MTLRSANYENRYNKLRDIMAREGYEAYLITKSDNVRYLTGFIGAVKLMVTADKAVLFAKSVDYIEAEATVSGCEVRRVPRGGEHQVMNQLCDEEGLESVAVNLAAMPTAVSEELADEMKPQIMACEDLLSELRREKGEAEINLLRKAVTVSEESLHQVLDCISPGETERNIAARLEYEMRKRGGDGLAFPTIVASGPRSAFCHARASDRELQRGDFVKIDFGVQIEGYPSDITRTFVLGEPSEKQRRVYDAVLRAQLAALETVASGVQGTDVHAAAAEVIADAGYGEHFIHGVGHGLAVGPSLSPSSDAVLQPGDVVTVEPGIYLPGWGGVRIEDDVLVTQGEPEILTSFTKELTSL